MRRQEVVIPRSDFRLHPGNYSDPSPTRRGSRRFVLQRDDRKQHAFIASSTMTHRAGIQAVRLVLGALAAGAVIGCATPAASAIGAPAASVDDGRENDSGVVVPAGFTHTFDYVPTVEDGMLVDPDGGCSSPIPLPTFFDVPCKQHDLGYDVLRYRSATRADTPDGERRRMDDNLGRALHRACDEHVDRSRFGCHVTADVAYAAVAFNSWRQHYESPEPEPALPILAAAAFGSIVVAALVPAEARVRATLRTTVNES